MHTKSLLTLSSFVVFTGSAAADPPDGSSPVSREQVRQSVLAARAEGTLAPAGPAYDGPPVHTDQADRSALARADVEAQVVAARGSGELRPAGETGDDVFTPPPPATSTVSRAEVKQETLQARANGELTPAGEAELPNGESQAVRSASTGKAPLFARANTQTAPK
jgi:hypothetical protein